jgi:hypothetical protein
LKGDGKNRSEWINPMRETALKTVITSRSFKKAIFHGTAGRYKKLCRYQKHRI